MVQQSPSPLTSHHIDDYVGTRIRLRRTLLGMTQEQLADALNISYQQIQKYETGANRVSAGRLYEIAQCLRTDISFFFEGAPPEGTPEHMPHGGHNRIAIDLVRNFLEIADEDMRSALANLIKTIKTASHDSEQPAGISDYTNS